MTNEPLLETERLELWLPQASDLDGLVALLDDESMTRFLGPARASHASQFERLCRNAGTWALHGYGTCALRLKGGDGTIVGTCGVFHSWRGFGNGMDDVPEAGWIVGHRHWGKGIAGEAMTAMLDWFDREHGRQRIACMITEGNVASERLAARLGFVAYDRHQPDEGEPLVLYERP
ncbi:MAG: GNAT family N-acetyltransferase [Erythrobacter sp.]|nr:GNAT family N-acetyltransferase [Erythrobacter sp.]